MEQKQLQLLEAGIRALGVTEDDPVIRHGDHYWYGLRLDSMMKACSDSSWDFPAFIRSLIIPTQEVEQEDQLDYDQITMYPEDDDEIMGVFQKFCPDLKPIDFIFDT